MEYKKINISNFELLGQIETYADPASGTSIDYMQDKGVPYIYGIELRPEDANNNFGFTIPAPFIEPTG